MRVMTIGDRSFDPHVTRRSLLTLKGGLLDTLVADLYRHQADARRAPGESDEDLRRRALKGLFDPKGDQRGALDGFVLEDAFRDRLDALAGQERAA